jgi:hypothetical protein
MTITAPTDYGGCSCETDWGTGDLWRLGFFTR